jgi:pimeloyl-ACP methyl ester carboxylesterase
MRALKRGSRGCRAEVIRVVVKARDQPRFKRFRFNEASLNLHRHCGDLHSKRLIVFVHGLNGNGYRTWGRFPRYIFDSPTQDPVDVALFDYFSGLRRRIFQRPPVAQIALILNERLREISKDYDEIFLVAHSMGGLISMDALRSYVAQRDEEPGLLRVLAGAIFIATPLNGSKWAHARVRLLASEWTELQPNSRYQQTLRRYVRRKIDSRHDAELIGRRHKLPIWSFVGSRDRIVEYSSATFGINRGQIRTVHKGHMMISKPCRSDSQVVTWTRDLIDEISSLRADFRDAQEKAKNAARPRVPADLVLVEFFAESDADDAWQPIYESAVNTAGSTRVRVEDRFVSGSTYPPNLLISAHRSKDLIARREMTRLKVEELRRHYDAGGAHARAIAVGSHREPAMAALVEMTGVAHQENQQYRLKFGSADDHEELRIRLSQYMAEIVARQDESVSQLDMHLLPGEPVQIVIDREER